MLLDPPFHKRDYFDGLGKNNPSHSALSRCSVETRSEIKKKWASVNFYLKLFNNLYRILVIQSNLI